MTNTVKIRSIGKTRGALYSVMVGLAEIVVGVLLSLTGILAIIGIPLALLGVFMIVACPWGERFFGEGACPACGRNQVIFVLKKKKQIKCQGCKTKLDMSNGELVKKQ